MTFFVAAVAVAWSRPSLAPLKGANRWPRMLVGCMLHTGELHPVVERTRRRSGVLACLLVAQLEALVQGVWLPHAHMVGFLLCFCGSSKGPRGPEEVVTMHGCTGPVGVRRSAAVTVATRAVAFAVLVLVCRQVVIVCVKQCADYRDSGGGGPCGANRSTVA